MSSAASVTATVCALPLPVAALQRRAHNAKSPKERHDTAYYAWEASVRLGLAARPPAEPGGLAMPSTGHWIAALTTSDIRLDDAALLSIHALFSEVGHGKPSGAKSTTPRKLLDGLAPYRNQVIGHGSTRTATFYQDAAERLIAGLDVAWSEGLFLARGTKLVFAESVEIAPEGTRVAQLIDLSRESPLVIDPRGTKVPDHVLPGQLYVRSVDGYTSLHSWLLYRDTELREQMLFFNGRAKSSQYLDYVGGEALKGKALAEAFPTIEDDVRNLLQSAATSSKVDERPSADLFGDYCILGKLGEGGMGVVYLPRQESLGRLVALKMLSASTAEDPVAVARFRREIKALSRCDHPNVVKIL